MSKNIIMFAAGGIEIVLGLIFLFVAKFPAIAILFVISGALFVASGVLTRKAEAKEKPENNG